MNVALTHTNEHGSTHSACECVCVCDYPECLQYYYRVASWCSVILTIFLVSPVLIYDLSMGLDISSHSHTNIYLLLESNINYLHIYIYIQSKLFVNINAVCNIVIPTVRCTTRLPQRARVPASHHREPSPRACTASRRHNASIASSLDASGHKVVTTTPTRTSYARNYIRYS